MFSGVVPTGANMQAPITTVSDDDAPLVGEDSNDLSGEHAPPIPRTDSSHRPAASVRGRGQSRKRHGAEFLRESLTQLVTSLSSTAEQVPTIKGPPTIHDAIQSLEKLPELFNNMSFYLFCTRILEDVSKREALLSIPLERRVAYLRYFYNNPEA